MQDKELHDFIVDKLDDLKARDIRVLDVTGKSTITDCMIICSGNSSRHVNSIADHLATEAKHAGLNLLGIEGQGAGEWVLVDLGDAIVHVMQEETRDFYQLEKLWGGSTAGAMAG
ncbi:ribosome silencing factor [Oceanimonas sp. CHS3-5]|uniref:ribosome silencing factor n=1 Tax=Oceanimonas sp. CHS3-5 TaxID=3068186 RepID=UPI00273FDF8A|nr:ribosome silencing factor [Oceanimonas sp. CHS3-5]MDP5292669.1 ribosome silencing factor [Oceanimonas sp. CHS3-5]